MQSEYSKIKNRLLSFLKKNQEVKSFMFCVDFDANGRLGEKYYRATISNITVDEIDRLLQRLRIEFPFVRVYIETVS